MWGIHRSPVNSPHKGQWRGALMFSLLCAWTNGWVNDLNTSYLRRHRAHYDVPVMINSQRTIYAHSHTNWTIKDPEKSTWSRQLVPVISESIQTTCHHSDIIISAMASRWFAQPFFQVQIKENIKAPRHWPLRGGAPATGNNFKSEIFKLTLGIRDDFFGVSG